MSDDCKRLLAMTENDFKRLRNMANTWNIDCISVQKGLNEALDEIARLWAMTTHNDINIARLEVRISELQDELDRMS